jgi:hypothetical protein
MYPPYNYYMLIIIIILEIKIKAFKTLFQPIKAWQAPIIPSSMGGITRRTEVSRPYSRLGGAQVVEHLPNKPMG